MTENQVEETLVMDLTDDMYVGSLREEVVDKFTCILCYGIIVKPLKCLNCNNLVCSKCVPSKRKKEGKFICYKKCGGKESTEHLFRQEEAVHQSLLFRCQNDDCDEKIPLGKYYEHMLKKCKVKTYTKVEQPEGAIADNNRREPNKNPYHGALVVGDLNELYLEPEEKLEDNIKNERNNAYDQLRYEDYDDEEYYDEDY